MSTELTLASENIIAPIRGQMIEISGSEEAAKRVSYAFSIAVRETPKLLECAPDSIQKEIMKCCADGLVPDSKEAVILPYFNKDNKRSEANYQPMVYGIIKRMKELGSVASITVELVHEADTFYVNLSDVEDTKHEFDIFSDDRGKVVGAYCITRDKDRHVIHREIMLRSDLDKVRQASKSPNSPAWKVWESEMFKKAVLRRLSKYISLDNDKLKQMIERIDQFFDYRQRQESQRLDPFAPKQIDSSGDILSRPDAEEGNPAKQSPSSTPSPAEVSSHPQQGASASGGGSTAPSDATDQKPKLTLDEMQAFSDHLWVSRRSKLDIEADAQQYKAKYWANKGVEENGRKLVQDVKRIHEDRVVKKDHATADKNAADELAKFGFEVPINALEGK